MLFFTDALVKQNLNSLVFVKTICEGRIKRLIDGVDDNIDVSISTTKVVIISHHTEIYINNKCVILNLTNLSVLKIETVKLKEEKQYFQQKEKRSIMSLFKTI